MRFLLFFISILFSFIFLSFSSFLEGKNIFGDTIFIKKTFFSLNGNLLFETIIFFIISLIFLFFFGNSILKNKNIFKKTISYKKIQIFLVTIFIILFFTPFIYNDIYIIAISSSFLFGEFCFWYLFKKKFFQNQRVQIKYIGILFQYIGTFMGLFYLQTTGFSFLVLYILFLSLFSNFIIHKKYINYISLFISIVILIFLLYFLLNFIYSKILLFI